VLSHETPVTIEMGKLSFTGRIDRIDQLNSGDIMLIDYKTGLTATQGWTTTPPTDPQLPLYALYSPQAVNQIAFAQIRTGALALKCFPEDATPPAFEEQKTTWKIALSAVGKAFESGVAHIAPSSSACRYCDLKTVCKGHVS
jgi:RecB family exonuclease